MKNELILLNYNTAEISELSFDEMNEIDGGFWWIVGAIAASFVAGFISELGD